MKAFTPSSKKLTMRAVGNATSSILQKHHRLDSIFKITVNSSFHNTNIHNPYNTSIINNNSNNNSNSNNNRMYNNLSIRNFASKKSNEKSKQVKKEKPAYDPHSASMNTEGGGSESDRLTQILIKGLDAKGRPLPSFTPEQQQEHYTIGRNYVIGNFKRHNEIHHDLACKLKLKHQAIRMLPKDDVYRYLRNDALRKDDYEQNDEMMPPMYRPIPMDTPPIPDYDHSKFLEK